MVVFTEDGLAEFTAVRACLGVTVADSDANLPVCDFCVCAPLWFVGADAADAEGNALLADTADAGCIEAGCAAGCEDAV